MTRMSSSSREARTGRPTRRGEAALGRVAPSRWILRVLVTTAVWRCGRGDDGPPSLPGGWTAACAGVNRATAFFAGTGRMQMFPRCRAEFNTPCAINWAWWLVHEIAQELSTTDDVDEVLANVSRGEYNWDFNFWPEVIDVNTGRFVASGAPWRLAERANRTVDDVFSEESHTTQAGLWRYVLARGDRQFFEFVGYDNYHTSGDGEFVGMSRVGYVEIVCREIDGANLAVWAAFSNVAANDLAQSCDSSLSQLCSTNYAAQAVGGVAAQLLVASNGNDVRMLLHDVSVGSYNTFSDGGSDDATPCSSGLDSGCFFPIVVDADTTLIEAHGFDAVSDHAFVGTSVLDPPFDILSMQEFDLPARTGGGFNMLNHTKVPNGAADVAGDNVSNRFRPRRARLRPDLLRLLALPAPSRRRPPRPLLRRLLRL